MHFGLSLPTIHFLEECWSRFVLKLIVAGVCFLFGFVVERLADQEPRSTHDGRFFNYCCTTIYYGFDTVGGLVIALLVARFVERVHGRLHLFQAKPGFGFAMLLIVIVSITGDFFYYWMHRWQHSSTWFWAIHELHHSDESVNVTTATRSHWIESALQATLGIFPALLLPAPETVIPLSYLLLSTNGFFNHLNAPIGFGWFNRVMLSPSGHRIHHSRYPEHIDKNFAGVWTFWDVLFGTYVHPIRGEHPPTGLFECLAVETIHAAFFSPFYVWHRMLFGAKAARAAMEDGGKPAADGAFDHVGTFTSPDVLSSSFDSTDRGYAGMESDAQGL